MEVESMVTINVATDFARTPGARFRSHGEFSGQEFREEFLEEHFRDPDDDTVVLVKLDGVAGYPTSFMDEAFGALARMYGKARCLQKLQFEASTQERAKTKILEYINKAD